MEETREAAKSVTNKKAVGPDELPPERLKLLPNEKVGRIRFHDTIGDTWRRSRVPQEWKYATIMVVCKKRDSTECYNYRGVSLVFHTRKVLLTIISHRLSYPEQVPISLRVVVGWGMPEKAETKVE